MKGKDVCKLGMCQPKADPSDPATVSTPSLSSCLYILKIRSPYTEDWNHPPQVYPYPILSICPPQQVIVMAKWRLAVADYQFAYGRLQAAARQSMCWRR